MKLTELLKEGRPDFDDAKSKAKIIVVIDKELNEIRKSKIDDRTFNYQTLLYHFKKKLEEGTIRESIDKYEIIWTDGDYKELKKSFPDMDAADKFAQTLVKKDKKSELGLYRTISLYKNGKSVNRY